LSFRVITWRIDNSHFTIHTSNASTVLLWMADCKFLFDYDKSLLPPQKTTTKKTP
jgi:hypothetical protein